MLRVIHFSRRNLDLHIAFPTGRNPPEYCPDCSDDLGFSDLKTYGGELHTPAINQLAREGVRFSQFYNSARCVPSRAALLTGLYPHQAGLGHMVADLGNEAYRGELSKKAVTLAEVLRTEGYFTAMTGKWHVTKNWRTDAARGNWPLQRGFDRFYGTIPGHGSLHDPYGLVEGNSPTVAGEGFYYTEEIGEKAVDYIVEAAKQDKPIFLYMAHVAPHYPLHARAEMVEQQKGLFKEGWDRLRSKRYQRLLDSGLLPKGTLLSSRDEQVPLWEDEPYPAWQQHRMEVYAAMMQHLDDSVADVLSALKAVGQLDNTYIFFLSDNGASPEGHLNNTIERIGRPWASAMIPINTRDGKPVLPGDWPNKSIGGPTTYGSYGIKWANLSNTPFRNHKSWVHEGGIASPLIVWGPNVPENQISHEVTHIIDLMPSFLAIADASYPSHFNGREIQSMEGENLMPVIHGSGVIAPRELFWEHEGNRAIRQGKWKLVSEYPGSWSSVRKYPKAGK